MFNRGQRFAFLLVLAARPAHYHVQGFHALQPIVSAGRCVSCRGTAASSAGGVVRPHAAAVASGCACATCVAPVSVWREVLGGRARRTRSTMVAMGEEGGEVAAAAVPEIDLTDKTVEELWMRVKKQLISVGKSGIKPSHVRSLNSLVAAHTLVKVKINIPNADLEEVGLELARKGGPALEAGAGDETGASPAVGVSVVKVNSNQNMILFANTDFLISLSKGDVFTSGEGR